MRAPCLVMLGMGQSAGLACARRFAEAKWSVMVVDGDRKTLDRAEKDLGEQCQYLHEDQHTRLGLKNALAGTLEQFSGVDVVLNVPAIPQKTPLSDMTVEAMTALFQKGAMASLMAAKVFGNYMIREAAEWQDQVSDVPHNKSFLTILSRAAVSTDIGQVAASVSQGSILAAVRALALEFAPHKIRSNAIISVRPRAEADEDWLKLRTPLGRSARPAELADMAFFLASSQAKFITGQGFELDGGRSVLNGLMPPSQ